MPKPKRKRHPNSDLAWKRSSLKGRLGLIYSVFNNMNSYLAGEDFKSTASLEAKKRLDYEVRIAKEQVLKVQTRLEELFALNPIKTKD